MAVLDKQQKGVGEPRDQSIDSVQIHDVLQNDRRRKALSYLLDNEGATSLRQMSENIAGDESGEDPPPRNKRNSVYISLHQSHLPKLDKVGIVEYDDSSKDVKLRNEVERIIPYLSPARKSISIQPHTYLLLGIGGALSVTGSVYGIQPFSFGEPVAWLVGYLLISMLCAGLEIHETRPIFHP